MKIFCDYCEKHIADIDDKCENCKLCFDCCTCEYVDVIEEEWHMTEVKFKHVDEGQKFKSGKLLYTKVEGLFWNARMYMMGVTFAPDDLVELVEGE